MTRDQTILKLPFFDHVTFTFSFCLSVGCYFSEEYIRLCGHVFDVIFRQMWYTVAFADCLGVKSKVDPKTIGLAILRPSLCQGTPQRYSRFQRSNTPSRGEYRKLTADEKDRASTLKYMGISYDSIRVIYYFR